MSATQPHRSTAKLPEPVFTAIAITRSRAHVLAALVDQAVEHFGGGSPVVSSVTVVACPALGGTTVFLAHAEIALAD